MITRTFLDKTTTIIKDTTFNYGLNPICMLNYGNLLSRIVIHFDIEKLRKLINDKTYCDLNKLKHVLKMKNCASINPEKTKQKMASADIIGVKERATSFTLIAFRVPQSWDEGIGFDNENDFWLTGKSATSQDGCTWYNSTNESIWPEEGIFSNDILSEEYDLFKQGKDSIVIAEQHFDHGNENMEMDLTNYVNDMLLSSGTPNDGICIAFSPELEETETKYTQYVGFFNEKTNTIFHPVLESRYDCDVHDDRMTFALNKENKLYLYSFIDGKLENLDEIPTCQIDGYSGNTIVEQESKGIYSTKLKLSSKDYHKDMILYDNWSNLKYNGEDIDDIELEFVTHPSFMHFSIGNHVVEPKVLYPIIVGINDNEKINKGEERVIKVFFRVPYSHTEFEMVNDSWYRLYTKDGDREIEIIDWDKIFKMDHHGFFEIDTNSLIPTEYHLDIKANFGDEIRIFKDELTFKIISEPNEQDL